jgi:hypothetical protein
LIEKDFEHVIFTIDGEDGGLSYPTISPLVLMFPKNSL